MRNLNNYTSTEIGITPLGNSLFRRDRNTSLRVHVSPVSNLNDTDN